MPNRNIAVKYVSKLSLGCRFIALERESRFEKGVSRGAKELPTEAYVNTSQGGCD